MKRFDCDTANWHVYARGARRLQLYRDDGDYLRFLNLLTYALRESGCVLLAYALMSNHYHLVLRGSSAQLTGCMRRLNCMYSHYHNQRYGLDGHTFDGPYNAFRQGTAGILLRSVAYVLFNPVQGGLCVRPQDFVWSCCKSYLNLPDSPLAVDPGQLIKLVHSDPKTAWAWFYRAMELEAKRPARSISTKPTMIELHQEQFRWLLEEARESPDRLKGEDPVVVAMYWARQVGVNPRAIAKVLAQTTVNAIRIKLARFKARLEGNPQLRSRLALT